MFKMSDNDIFYSGLTSRVMKNGLYLFCKDVIVVEWIFMHAA